MSGSLLRPDLRAAIKDLQRRIGVLERRLTPRPAATPVAEASHNHDGAGTDAIIVSGDTQTTVPTAAGGKSVAVGDAASSPGGKGVAVGYAPTVTGIGGIAVGSKGITGGSPTAAGLCVAVGSGDSWADGPVADGTAAIAIGSGVSSSGAHGPAAHAAHSIAMGTGASIAALHTGSVGIGAATTAGNQFNVGQKQAFLGAPNRSTPDAELAGGQVTFALDQATNTLVVKVKYDDASTVKTATIALV